jgi:hypothetical protein
MATGLKKNRVMKAVELSKRGVQLLEAGAKLDKRKLKNFMEKILEEKAIEIEIQEAGKV